MSSSREYPSSTARTSASVHLSSEASSAPGAGAPSFVAVSTTSAEALASMSHGTTTACASDAYEHTPCEASARLNTRARGSSFCRRAVQRQPM